jgi:endonuclease-3
MEKIEKVPQATEQEIKEIKALLLRNYPKAVTELNYRNLYELLVSVILSAQCTDNRVNTITPALFEKYPDIISLANADIGELTSLIKKCSFYNIKARNLKKMAKTVAGEYNLKIPLEKKELMKLAGVGQKTANVVMLEYMGANVMAVDTHVFRVAHRLGLSDAKTADKTEEDLTRKFKTKLNQLHQAMVLFGRYKCKALKPFCYGCFLMPYCKSKERFKV